MATAKTSKTKPTKKKLDNEQTGLFKEVLSVIFNVQPKQINRMMDILKRSEDIINIKTRIVLDHAGPRAVKLIRQAVEYARHEGSEKHETEQDDFEMTKKVDISDILSVQNPRATDFQHRDNDDEEFDQREKKPIHECTFKEYLMELMVSDDPQQAMKDVRMAKQNPAGYNKLQTKNTIDQKKQIMGDTEDENKAERMRINDSERKLLTQKKMLADKEKRQGTEEDNALNVRGDTGERPAAGMVP